MTTNSTEDRLTRLEGIYERIDERLGDMNATLGRMDARLAAMDERLDSRLAAMDERLDRRLVAMDAHIDRRFAEMDARIDKRFADVDKQIESVRKGLHSFMIAVLVGVSVPLYLLGAGIFLSS